MKLSGIMLANFFLLLASIGCENPLDQVTFFPSTYVDESQWPFVFTELLRKAQVEGINTDAFRLSSVYSDECFLECKSSSKLLAIMIESWKLKKVDENEPMARRFRERLPADFLPLDSKLDYYLSLSWIQGGEGDLLCVFDNGKHIWVRFYIR